MARYTIFVEDKLWREFKSVISRDKTINQHIVELIKRYVSRKKKS